MVGDWVLVAMMMVPVVGLGYLRYRLVKRWSGKNAASVVAGFLLVSVGVGVYKRQQTLTMLHQADPQAFRFHANPLIRRLYTPDTAPTTITDSQTAQEVFTYYRTDGAARLNAVTQPAPQQWLATFSLNTSEPQNPKLKGYFETCITDETRVLPLTRLYRSWFGSLRVEDVQSGQTIFSYNESSSPRPVEMSKIETAAGIYEWQVRFTNAPGLDSQQAAVAQP